MLWTIRPHNKKRGRRDRPDWRLRPAPLSCRWLSVFNIHLKASVASFTRHAVYWIIIHRFYTAPFSAVEQTHCAHVAGDSQWVTVSFLYRVFLISPEVVYWYSSLVAAWLVPREMLPSRRTWMTTTGNKVTSYGTQSFKKNKTKTKNALYKSSHSRRITCKRSESAQESGE